MNTIVVEAPGERARRRHSAQFKAQVIQACRQPRVSMASVALANGLNATMLRKWVVESERDTGIRPALAAPADARTPAFLPVAVPDCAPAADIRIEIERGATRITVSWPSAAAPQCATWLRDLLR